MAVSKLWKVFLHLLIQGVTKCIPIYRNSSKTTIIKKALQFKKLVKSQSGHAEKPFADHMCDLQRVFQYDHFAI